MKVKSFRIRNFKGISDCTIDFCNDDSKGRIITLIGLNESGKTTVLEAISHFINQDESLPVLVGTSAAQQQPKLDELVRTFVPKHRKANFSDEIEITGTVEFEDADKLALEKFFRENHELDIQLSKLPKSISITKKHKFENSDYKSTGNYWTFVPYVKRRRQRIYRALQSAGEDRPIWLAATRVIAARLPRICYFSTFLFDVPEKIYLDQEAASATPSMQYYRGLAWGHR